MADRPFIPQLYPAPAFSRFLSGGIMLDAGGRHSAGPRSGSSTGQSSVLLRRRLQVRSLPATVSPVAIHSQCGRVLWGCAKDGQPVFAPTPDAHPVPCPLASGHPTATPAGLSDTLPHGEALKVTPCEIPNE